MPLSKLVFKPGINRDQTDYASEGGWYACDKIRFRSGFPEKIGGWRVTTPTAYVGAARSLFSWRGSSGEDLVMVGTNEKVYVVAGNNLYDITPIRSTRVSPATDNCFATTNGSNQVTVSIATHGAIEGDWVTFSGATGPVGGIPASDLNKEFKITNVTTGSFRITVSTTATSTVAAGGGTAITAAFQLNIGYSTITAGYGWGAGSWGRNGWGTGSTIPLYFPVRFVYADNYANNLFFNIASGDLFYWEYNGAFPRAVYINDLPGAVAVPQQVVRSMFASSGHYLALGCTNYDASAAAPDYLGSFDPLLIRWANVDPDIGPEPENWQPTLTNSAGFIRLQNGSKIVSTIRTRQEILVFTDTSLYSLQYLGTSEVFSQQELSNHISILGPNVSVGANNITYWMGTDKFYIYSGRVDTLPCTLRQYVFDDINRGYGDLFFGGSNTQFNEIVWFYASATSNTIDRYVIYNFAENIWYYGQLARTAWLDSVNFGRPVAAQDGWVYTHEVGHDDGQPNGNPPQPIESYIQSADVDIDDGDKYMLIRRVIPDINFNSSDTNNYVTNDPLVTEAQITVGVRGFPGAAAATNNLEGQNLVRDVVTTAVLNQYTNQVFLRARGRQMSFKISSDGVGVQWQLGMPRVDARPDGARG